MAKKRRDYSDQLILILLVVVVIISVLSLAVYITVDESGTKNKKGSETFEITPQTETQGTVSLVLEKPKGEDETNSK